MISSKTISDHDVNGHCSGSNGNGMQSRCWNMFKVTDIVPNGWNLLRSLQDQVRSKDCCDANDIVLPISVHNAIGTRKMNTRRPWPLLRIRLYETRRINQDHIKHRHDERKGNMHSNPFARVGWDHARPFRAIKCHNHDKHRSYARRQETALLNMPKL